MQHRHLGNTGLSVSIIGLGLVKLGRNTAVKYPKPFDLPDDQQAMQLLDTAADLGINLLDTAPAYGTSEQRLGKLLEARADRDAWIISTKAGESFADGKSAYDFSPSAIINSCTQSLRRLRTDRIDLFMLHSDGRAETRFDEIGSFDALDDLKRRGLIRATGASVKTAQGAAAAIPRVDALMLEYSIDAPAMADTIEHAAARAVGVLVKKALGSGRVGKQHEHSPAEALAFALNPSGVTSVVVGTINPEHLRENAGAIAGLGDQPR